MQFIGVVGHRFARKLFCFLCVVINKDVTPEEVQRVDDLVAHLESQGTEYGLQTQVFQAPREIITIKDQQRERLSKNDSPDGDVNVVCNSRLFSLILRRMVVRSFINSVLIIKAIVFSFYFSSKKLILAQMFIYYMNKKKSLAGHFEVCHSI